MEKWLFDWYQTKNYNLDSTMLCATSDVGCGVLYRCEK
jgi:hypothetical protein